MTICDLTPSAWHCPENHRHDSELLSHLLTLNQIRSLAEYLRYNDGLWHFIIGNSNIVFYQDANKTCDFHFVGLLLCRMLCPFSKERLPVNFQPSDRALVVQGFKRNEVSQYELKGNKYLLKYFREFLHQTFAGGPLNERGPCTVPSGRFNEER